MSFNDENTLEDIRGVYLLASCWGESMPDVDIHKQAAEFVERIEYKIARNRNRTRHNWFAIAMHHARTAKQQFGGGDFKSGRESLDLAWRHLESGNKASRRRTTFVAGSDGGIQAV